MAINATAAASRQAWSFARDGYSIIIVHFCDSLLTMCRGLPFPTWFTRLVVIDSVPLPLNAILASMLFVLILALLVLGGDQAFNSIVGLLNGAVGLTYVLSIGCVLWRRTFGEPLPPARWSLGKLGIPLNIIAVLYQAFATVISFFPLFAEVTAANFNWYVFMQDLCRQHLTCYICRAIAMFALAIIIALVNYYTTGKKIYAGPVVTIIKDA